MQWLLNSLRGKPKTLILSFETLGLISTFSLFLIPLSPRHPPSHCLISQILFHTHHSFPTQGIFTLCLPISVSGDTVSQIYTQFSPPGSLFLQVSALIRFHSLEQYHSYFLLTSSLLTLLNLRSSLLSPYPRLNIPLLYVFHTRDNSKRSGTRNFCVLNTWSHPRCVLVTQYIGAEEMERKLRMWRLTRKCFVEVNVRGNKGLNLGKEKLVPNYTQIIIQGMYYTVKEWTMKADGLQITSWTPNIIFMAKCRILYVSEPQFSPLTKGKISSFQIPVERKWISMIWPRSYPWHL